MSQCSAKISHAKPSRLPKASAWTFIASHSGFLTMPMPRPSVHWLASTSPISISNQRPITCFRSGSSERAKPPSLDARQLAVTWSGDRWTVLAFHLLSNCRPPTVELRSAGSAAPPFQGNTRSSGFTDCRRGDCDDCFLRTSCLRASMVATLSVPGAERLGDRTTPARCCAWPVPGLSPISGSKASNFSSYVMPAKRPTLASTAASAALPTARWSPAVGGGVNQPAPRVTPCAGFKAAL
mmetsp:Transcript_34422/g.99936  ORF Transcript_34422/g.99936 Transcript_34422/m.99936 type:complete len:239 (-) Transcript_34422:32-748(-)